MTELEKAFSEYEKMHLVNDTKPNLHLFFEISKEFNFHRFECYIADNQTPKSPEVFRVSYRIADKNLIDATCKKIYQIVSLLFPDNYWHLPIS